MLRLIISKAQVTNSYRSPPVQPSLPPQPSPSSHNPPTGSLICPYVCATVQSSVQSTLCSEWFRVASFGGIETHISDALQWVVQRRHQCNQCGQQFDTTETESWCLHMCVNTTLSFAEVFKQWSGPTQTDVACPLCFTKSSRRWNRILQWPSAGLIVFDFEDEEVPGVATKTLVLGAANKRLVACDHAHTVSFIHFRVFLRTPYH